MEVGEPLTTARTAASSPTRLGVQALFVSPPAAIARSATTAPALAVGAVGGAGAGGGTSAFDFPSPAAGLRLVRSISMCDAVATSPKSGKRLSGSGSHEADGGSEARMVAVAPVGGVRV